MPKHQATTATHSFMHGSFQVCTAQHDSGISSNDEQSVSAALSGHMAKADHP